MVVNVGVPNIQPPKKECNDPYCPFHGTREVRVRGRIFKGKVVSAKMTKAVIVTMDYYYKDRKYERLARASSRVPAHLPDCIEVEEGDYVRMMECRPISKTVRFVVLEKTSKELGK